MTLGMVFPGQGSQSVGMLASLAQASPLVGETFAEAGEVLGLDLWQIVAEGPEERLNDTRITQPAMLAAGIATWRVWQAGGGAAPAIMAGHSLGEYTALVAAGAMAFSDAVHLVSLRAQYMQEAVPAGVGAMAAILGLDDDRVREVCATAAEEQVVEAVNFNSPGQVVIAGDKHAVERAIALAREAGARRAVPLPVSVPSHCALMQPAASRLAAALDGIDISRPGIPVLHNFDVQSHDDPAQIRQALEAQLYSPVRWVETIRAMQAAGVNLVVECGPGKVLAGLNKRIDKGLTSITVQDPESLQQALQAAAGEQA